MWLLLRTVLLAHIAAVRYAVDPTRKASVRTIDRLCKALQLQRQELFLLVLVLLWLAIRILFRTG